MRLWTLHPRYLDPKGLVTAWREALLAQKVLSGATRGYRPLHRLGHCIGLSNSMGGRVRSEPGDSTADFAKFPEGDLSKPIVGPLTTCDNPGQSGNKSCEPSCEHAYIFIRIPQ